MLKSGSATIVSAGSRLVGEMFADEEIVLAGTFEGVLRTTRSLQVAATGCILGEVHADSVLVLGRVVGPITAVDRIELQAGSNVEGDLAAQRVRIHDDVIFNGHCRISGPEAARRQYLVPAIVQVLGEESDPQALESVERAAEGFLRDFGFEVEVRPDHATRGSQALRPIFRSRDAMPYAQLREQLRSVQVALQSATFPGPPPGRHLRAVGSTATGGHNEPLQTTGADGARALVEAMGQLRDGALMLGPVIVTRFEAERGPRLAVRVRDDSLPPESVAAGGAPDPGTLLLSLQKAQSEVARDLLASAMARSARPAAGA